MHRKLTGIAIAVALVLTAMNLEARSRKSKATRGKSSSFDYFLLVLSYAPDFCAQPSGNKDPRECGAGRHVGFVVHGLWPQDENSRGPESCGSASPVSQSLVQTMLKYFPTESLIQHEWATHGTCSGLNVTDYFAAVRKARDAVTIPTSLTPSSKQSLSPSDIEAKVAAANPKVLPAAIRATCYSDKELQEVRICLTKGLSPRACGSSAGSCTATKVTLLPLR